MIDLETQTCKLQADFGCLYVHVCMYLGCKFNTFYPYFGFLSYQVDGFSVFYVGLIGNLEDSEAQSRESDIHLF